MANSKFEYVKLYESDDRLLPRTYIVIRVDGRGFHQFSKKYDFEKPNDLNALNCMNKAAEGVMRNVQDVFLAYGQSDEYSFVFLKDTNLFERRASKLMSTVVSTFTANYIHAWSQLFPNNPLDGNFLPTFDSRAVMYPDVQSLKDYFSWRQADCHINNLYNTTFWTLVQKGQLTPHDAQTKLIGTLSADKNEILFTDFGINYNNEPEMFKKGSILRWEKLDHKYPKNPTKRQLDKYRKSVRDAKINILHCDIIKDEQFWNDVLAEEDTAATTTPTS